MIYVYHRPAKGKASTAYEIIESSTQLIVNFTRKMFKGQFKLKKEDYANCCIDVYAGFDSGGETITIVQDLLKQDPFKRIDFRNQDYYTKLARIVFDDDTIHVHLQGGCENIDGFKNIEIKDDEFSTDLLLKNSKLFEKVRRRYKAKAELLKGVSIFESISYIENQLDLITRVIMQNKDKFEQTKELSMLFNFNCYSSLDIKDDILKETAVKKDVREQQLNYFKNR